MYCIYIISASPLLLQLLPCPTLSHIPDFFIFNHYYYIYTDMYYKLLLYNLLHDYIIKLYI